MLFPTLKGKVAVHAPLNEWAKQWVAKRYPRFPRPNPLLDPMKCQEMVEEYHKLLRADYSFGGYLEDRSTLWRGSYLDEEKKFVHLGVDFNVPIGTPVAMSLNAQVVLVDNDTPEVGGWGTRVMAKVSHHDVVLVYAHLDRSVSCKAGDVLGRGDVFARVGAPDCNGGWYPHLHAQGLSMGRYEQFRENPDGLDGYANAHEGELAEQYPYPLRWLQI